MSRVVQFIIKLFSVRAGVELGHNVHIGPFSILSSPTRLHVGQDTYIGKFCTIQVSGRIGRGVLIGNSVGIVGRYDHEFQVPGTLIRASPAASSDAAVAARPENSIDIGDDVWIGYGSTILSGIRIGMGAIVAAGSTVVHDVADYSIVAGAPASMKSMRFGGDADLIAFHSAAISERYPIPPTHNQ